MSLLSLRSGGVSAALRGEENRDRAGAYRPPEPLIDRSDVCFLLDELAGAHPAWPGAGLIDPSRMGMAGHSAGGAAAIAAMLADSRIRAGIDMDGSTAAPIPDEGLARPFLFLGKLSNYTPGGGRALRDRKLRKGAVITWERD